MTFAPPGVPPSRGAKWMVNRAFWPFQCLLTWNKKRTSAKRRNWMVCRAFWPFQCLLTWNKKQTSAKRRNWMVSSAFWPFQCLLTWNKKQTSAKRRNWMVSSAFYILVISGGRALRMLGDNTKNGGKWMVCRAFISLLYLATVR